MDRDHRANALGPGRHRTGQNPRFQIRAQMAFRKKDDIEAGAIGRDNDIFRQLKS